MSKMHQETEYLTKAVMKRAVSKGVKQASERAMETAGSLVEVEGDWVVRRYKDGHTEKLEQLPKISAMEIEQKINRLTCG